MTSDTVLAPEVGIVGRGRVGRAFARALSGAGAKVHGPWGRGGRAEEVPDDALVLLCVPDAEVAAAAHCIRPGPLVGHCAGALTLESLGGREGFSLHPLLSVTGQDADFRGAWCAIAGSSERASTAAGMLARTVGMHAVHLADADRPLYHAAASLAANHLVGVLDAAEHAMSAAGVRREALVPLVQAAVRNWAAHGSEAALTGPLLRGDDDTVRRQREAMATRMPELLPLWDALTVQTRTLAARARSGAGA